MAGFLFRLELEGGTPADPPSFETAVHTRRPHPREPWPHAPRPGMLIPENSLRSVQCPAVTTIVGLSSVPLQRKAGTPSTSSTTSSPCVSGADRLFRRAAFWGGPPVCSSSAPWPSAQQQFGVLAVVVSRETGRGSFGACFKKRNALNLRPESPRRLASVRSEGRTMGTWRRMRRSTSVHSWMRSTPPRRCGTDHSG